MTLAAIAELVEGLQISPDRAELAAAFGVRDRLDAKIALAVAEAETAGVPELDGCLSTQSWLRHHTGRDPKSAAKTTTAGQAHRLDPPPRRGRPDHRTIVDRRSSRIHTHCQRAAIGGPASVVVSVGPTRARAAVPASADLDPARCRR